MLGTYPDQMTNEKGKKLYPLSDWANRNVLSYIDKARLIKPIQYGYTGNIASQGTDVSDKSFLFWMREKFPQDLARTIREFPEVERLIFEFDHEESNQ